MARYNVFNIDINIGGLNFDESSRLYSNGNVILMKNLNSYLKHRETSILRESIDDERLVTVHRCSTPVTKHVFYRRVLISAIKDLVIKGKYFF